MGTLSTLRTVLSLLPAIIEAIKAIEEAIPGQGKGEQKLAAIRGIVAASYEQAAAIMPILERVIGVLVDTFNAVGVFTKR
jgi:hypothetical protein